MNIQLNTHSQSNNFLGNIHLEPEHSKKDSNTKLQSTELGSQTASTIQISSENLSKSESLSTVPMRVPGSEVQTTSIHSSAVHLVEKYESLLSGASGTFRTPNLMFQFIPSQSAQLALGIQQGIDISLNFGKIGADLAGQMTLGFPFLQRAFQSVVSQLKTDHLKFAENIFVRHSSSVQTKIGVAQPSAASAQKSESLQGMLQPQLAQKLEGSQSPEANKCVGTASKATPLKNEPIKENATVQTKAPAKKGFFSKLKSAFSKIAKVFTKIMDFAAPFLQFIPGVGQAISTGWGILRGLMQSAKGGAKNFFSSVLGALPSIGGLGSKLSSLGSGVLGKIGGLLQKAPKLSEGLSSVASIASKATQAVPKLIKSITGKTS